MSYSDSWFLSIRQVLALSFLLEELIAFFFHTWGSHAPVGSSLALINYIRDTWVSGRWTPRNWIVIGQSIRTNNDVAGYRKTKWQCRQLPHSILRTALTITMNLHDQVHLVKGSKLVRYQKRAYKSQQGRIFALWQEYRDMTNIISPDDSCLKFPPASLDSLFNLKNFKLFFFLFPIE